MFLHVVHVEKAWSACISIEQLRGTKQQYPALQGSCHCSSESISHSNPFCLTAAKRVKRRCTAFRCIHAIHVQEL